MTAFKGDMFALRRLAHVDEHPETEQGGLGYTFSSVGAPFQDDSEALEDVHQRQVPTLSFYEAMTDEQLMTIVKNSVADQELAIERGQAAFSILYERHNDFVARVAHAKGGLTGQNLDDAVAQVFCNAWQYAKSWDEERATNFEAWLGTITRNAVMKMHEKRMRYGRNESDFGGAYDDDDRPMTVEPVDGQMQPLDAMAEDELLGLRDETFWEALGSLKSSDWGIILNHHFYGKSIDECGQETGVSMTTAKMRLYRARQKLAKEIIKLQGVEGQEAAEDGLFLD